MFFLFTVRNAITTTSVQDLVTTSLPHLLYGPLQLKRERRSRFTMGNWNRNTSEGMAIDNDGFHSAGISNFEKYQHQMLLSMTKGNDQILLREKYTKAIT